VLFCKLARRVVIWRRHGHAVYSCSFNCLLPPTQAYTPCRVEFESSPRCRMHGRDAQYLPHHYLWEIFTFLTVAMQTFQTVMVRSLHQRIIVIQYRVTWSRWRVCGACDETENFKQRQSRPAPGIS